MPKYQLFHALPLDKIYITQGFGANPSYYRKYGLPGHNGLDFRTRFIDSPLGHRYVYSVWEGEVVQVRYDRAGYGTHIRIRHSDGSLTIYGHLTKVYVSKGGKVKAGQRIGLSDNTGDSSGPHLHLEVRDHGWESKGASQYYGAIDPKPLLNAFYNKPEEVVIKPLIDPVLTKRLEGRLLLQVEDRGRLWLVLDGKRHYLGTTAKEYNAFMAKVRSGEIKVVGITDSDINKIPN